MTKKDNTYCCNICGHEAIKWQGQCPSCKSWDTLHRSHKGFAGSLSAIKKLTDVNLTDKPRFKSGIQELDRVLGGGFVPGSSILIGGNPGAGKSTLLLQALTCIANNLSALYVSGEESLQQIASRAHRLGIMHNRLNLLAETSVEEIIAIAKKEKPAILVIDSIQVMYVNGVESAPGSITQVRESAAMLTNYAKQTDTVIFMVGHVTKDNSLAGPMTLAHIVDTQLMLVSSNDSRFRMLRAIKNRFGKVNELGIFAMMEKGLKEVKNPSAIFLNRTQQNTSGSIVNVLWEGSRPLLVEIQALVVDSQLGNPRRVTVGMDNNRIVMLLAILNRHGNIFTAQQDVFINVVGGIRIMETSADLACLLAIVSSLRNLVLPKNLMAFGEVGLSGEIRPISSGYERINEATKHGFTRIIVPNANKPKKLANVEIIGVDLLQEAINNI